MSCDIRVVRRDAGGQVRVLSLCECDCDTDKTKHGQDGQMRFPMKLMSGLWTLAVRTGSEGCIVEGAAKSEFVLVRIERHCQIETRFEAVQRHTRYASMFQAGPELLTAMSQPLDKYKALSAASRDQASAAFAAIRAGRSM